MKKLIFVALLLFILLNSTLVQSQTKGDTQIWIKSTIENYVNKDRYRLLNVYFDDNTTSILTTELLGSKFHYEKMFIKDISQVMIKETEFDYELRLGCNYGNSYCCETGTHEIKDDGMVKIIPSDDRKTRIVIFLDKSLKNDDMTTRLKKALTHLIMLNGGTVKTETF